MGERGYGVLWRSAGVLKVSTEMKSRSNAKRLSMQRRGITINEHSGLDEEELKMKAIGLWQLQVCSGC